MTLRTTVAALAAATLLSLPARAEPVDLGNVAIAPDTSTFTLDNGLQVVVIPDRRAPIVTHMIWYRIGSADEAPGKSGIAHYLEHLMFKGTEAHPGNAFSSTVSRLGGRENAFTSNDYTAYFQQVAKEHLPQMMAFEADRMRGLQLTEEVSAPELQVVLEERRMRVDTQPSAELGEAVDAALYVNHPYGDPVIGWADEVANLTFEDAINFYHDFYRPGAAVLVIAGDVTEDEIRRLAADTYGAIADDAGPFVRSRPPVQKLRADRLVELRDPRVTQETTQVSWVVPSYNTAEPGEAEALDVLAEVLGGNNTSRLYTALVRNEGLATSAGSWYQSSAYDDTRFVVYATPTDGSDLAAIEDRAKAIVADIARDGISEEELSRAKTNLLSSVIFAQDNQSSLARIFGAAITTGSTVDDIKAWPSHISKVTAADVQKAAQTYIDGKAAVTGRLLEAPDEEASQKAEATTAVPADAAVVQ
ncbi:pitrilysin family protein [Acuticoccus sp. I52.16.1]|uniref:M16 family metallopeptidase n=1 Tax=Acuticoccus sp. I52.16.1 TaxID=2928472 RepID=UPI001FD0095E|nr:pitrilysin family protein [Acuticoccus sp. I52.16.1]UOM33365.1 insulinase family protein [Acuticoccus sp. I52.16.1]